MMLNLNALNYNVFCNCESVGTVTDYTSITIKGEGIFDRLWVRNRIETISYWNVLTPENYEPAWDTDTILLANFEDTLDAGNIGIGEDITAWELYRYKSGDSLQVLVGSLNTNIKEFSDYRVTRDSTYSYQLWPKLSVGYLSRINSASLTSDYCHYLFLIDEDDDTVYLFNYNLSTDSFDGEDDQSQTATFEQFDSFSSGQRNFIKGTISAIVGSSSIISATDGIAQSPSFVDSLRTFITNGTPKILKTRKGDVWKVMTKGFKRKQVNDGIGQQIEIITFSFTQCEEITV
jgi:hypothetical protein